jgi:hypothetical protein
MDAELVIRVVGNFACIGHCGVNEEVILQRERDNILIKTQ